MLFRMNIELAYAEHTPQLYCANKELRCHVRRGWGGVSVCVRAFVYYRCVGLGVCVYVGVCVRVGVCVGVCLCRHMFRCVCVGVRVYV